jgi:DNA-binding ferritin-like protein (Dps family)
MPKKKRYTIHELYKLVKEMRTYMFRAIWTDLTDKEIFDDIQLAFELAVIIEEEIKQRAKRDKRRTW